MLGPATGEGNKICQWVLKANGKVVPRRTCVPLTTAQWMSPVEIHWRKIFEDLIEGRFGNTVNPIKENWKIPRHDIDPNDDFIEYEDDDKEPITVPEIHEAVDSRGHAINTNPAYDALLNTEFIMQNGNKWDKGKTWSMNHSYLFSLEKEPIKQDCLEVLTWQQEWLDEETFNVLNVNF